MEIRLITTSDPEYKAVFDLRERVLRKPLGQSLYNDDLRGEPDELILTAYDGVVLVGCLMLRPLADGEIKLRQMAVAPETQGRGVGAELVRAAEELVRKRGFNRMVLNARNYALGFYERLGYSVEGQGFEEVGIPHHFMCKSL
jgi:ribosomal protein S18 acetylase RimI-like enzyme